jgi:hypothetical protein
MEPLNTPTRNPELWQQAKSRARFKTNLFSYLSINAMLWVIWALTDHGTERIPWPVWSTVFWGIGVAMQGFRAYGGWNQRGMAEREYERLTRQQ